MSRRGGGSCWKRREKERERKKKRGKESVEVLKGVE
jgi:hypothetical protein